MIELSRGKIKRIMFMNYDKFTKLCISQGTKPTSLMIKLGLSKGNSSKWKKGGNPSVNILIRISKELDCSIDYLLDLTDNPEVNK